MVKVSERIAEEKSEGQKEHLRKSYNKLRDDLDKLTTVTTIFGLIFLASGYSIDVINREIFEGTSTVKWYQVFGIAICSGLGFSTIITLLVTPSFLMVLENMRDIREKGRSFVLSIPNRIRGR